MNQVVGLPTLMWHFMNREVQKERVDPVSSCIPPLNALYAPSELISCDFTVGERSRCHGPLQIRRS